MVRRQEGWRQERRAVPDQRGGCGEGQRSGGARQHWNPGGHADGKPHPWAAATGTEVAHRPRVPSVMRFASLGSGSQGNGLVVEAGGTRVLLDCGFGLAQTASRLGRIGIEPAHLDAVIVTHEHEDHIGGVARLARRYGIPVWLTHGTLAGFEPLFDDVRELRVVQNYEGFAVGGIEVTPFPVPHDAREPAQYVFTDGARRLGVLTDTGCSTPHIESMLSGCDALVLECNHDAEMLRISSYPKKLRDRIASRYGHLDNQAAAEL